MSLQHLLTSLIRSEFLARAGKWQERDPSHKAMLFSFAIPTKAGEEGYRDLDVLIYAPANYVGVYTRERWNVINESDLGDDDEGPLPGKDYEKGESAWTCAAYHDSCWSEGIEEILKKRHLLTWGHQPNDSWCQIVDASSYNLPER